MTQAERVLALSKRFNGVAQVDLLRDPPDGGRPITRLAARIQDLKDAGHVFERLPDRGSTKTYRWVDGPDVDGGGGGRRLSPSPAVLGVGSPAPAVSARDAGRLFEPAPQPHWRDQ